MRRTIVTLAGVLGFLGVALGAFGAHGLKDWLATMPDGEQRLQWWHTGTQYQVVHALLLLGLASLSSSSSQRALRVGTWAAVVGVVLFSGSLYAMTFTGIKLLGAVTPLGGVAFLTSWTCVVLAARGLPERE
jgi:uncharacterized membrane protein YgdD (TMEM256/DUF423 family)